MLINGQQVVESDYRAMHPTLAYALAGKKLNGDPYDVGPHFDRAEVKRGMLIALNATTPRSAVAALAEVKKIDRKRSAQIIQAIFNRHRPIEKVLCSDAGLTLMNVDATIMMEVATKLTAVGVPVIPIHDSVCIPAKFAVEAEAAMTEIWEKRVGRLNPCTIARKSQDPPHMGE
jgi:hypothetical protein